MPRAKWDQPGEHFYETGVKNCMLYIQDGDGEYPDGEAWNGITSISENPSGADANKLYADDTQYLNLRAVEEFGGSIEAYTYPESFRQCNGEEAIDATLPGVILGQQGRKTFGLCYRTAIGNDIDGSDYGAKIHLIYGATCSPSERGYETINDSPEAITFSWDFETVPVPVNGFKNVSCVTIDLTKLAESQVKALEDALYGVDADATESIEDADPYLPLPDALKALLVAAAPSVGP